MEHSNFEDLSMKRVHGKILFVEIFDLILKRLSTQDCFSQKKWFGMQIIKTVIPIKPQYLHYSLQAQNIW